jgi:hypothetical protein
MARKGVEFAQALSVEFPQTLRMHGEFCGNRRVLFRDRDSQNRQEPVEKLKKSGAPAWDQGPRRVRFVAGVVFTPARGVIHPSFPLRGRWERIVKSNEQAPSPSLAAPHNASCETHSRQLVMQGPRQSQGNPGFLISDLLATIYAEASAAPGRFQAFHDFSLGSL